MNLGSQQYAALASDAYIDRMPGGKDITLDGVAYKVLEHMSRSSGYQGTIYQRADTGQIVVAHRGTEFDKEPWKDGLFTDGGMVLNRDNRQTDDAIELTKRALNYASLNLDGYVPPPQVTVTGHSLGGTLAQITAHHFNLRGETFNAYGAPSVRERMPAGGNSVLNHVMAGDPVSAGARHYGQVRVYATPDEVRTLQDRGYDNTRNPLDARFAAGAAGDLVAASHAMQNFLDVDANGRADKSVLGDPQARLLADYYDPMFDKYRTDVRLIRTQISLYARGPMGLADDLFDQVRGPLPAGEPDARARQHSPGQSAPSTLPACEHTNHLQLKFPDYVPVQSQSPPIPLRPDGDRKAASLDDDPSAFVGRMLAAAQSGNADLFRQLTRTAADSDPGRALRAEAVTAVDRQEQWAVQQLAVQQQAQDQQIQQQVRNGPRMA